MGAAGRVRSGGAAGASASLARLCAEGGGAPPRAQVAEVQRSRLLAAAVHAVEELGYARATVAHITHRARVSRRTFYELFSDRDDCLTAVFEDVVGRLEVEVGRAGLEGLSWRERVRAGLWVILAFFDREPALARVCVAQSARGSQGVLRRREEILTRLASVVDEGRVAGSRGRECPPVIAEGLVGAALAIVCARVSRRDREPLLDLLGELMSMIVLPFMGPAVARREQARPALAPTAIQAAQSACGVAGAQRASLQGDPLQGDLFQSLPMRLTYRTMRVLETIAERPGISNRGVSERAGVSDQGQISRLLARLERLGLILNSSGEAYIKGEPNAWTLTATGERVAQAIRVHAGAREEAAL